MVKRVLRAIYHMYDRLEAGVFPIRHKERHELAYWKSVVAAEEGRLWSDFYITFYTSHFGLEPSFYSGKRILDIGCGPLGSLEWAEMAAERIGIDPLVPSYLKLGAKRHKMKYIATPSDAIPFPRDYFDVVCSFNSLDHVANLDKTISEIKRVVQPGGLFLLITEVNHPPTINEPLQLPWSITEAFTDTFELIDEKRYEIGDHDIYGQILKDHRFDDSDKSDRPGILSAQFLKRYA